MTGYKFKGMVGVGAMVLIPALVPPTPHTTPLAGVVCLAQDAPAQDGAALLKQADTLAAAGKYQQAAAVYGKAAAAFEAAGKTEQQADALEKSAAMYEKWADQLTKGHAPATAPATPATTPAAATPAAATPAKPAPAAPVKPLKLPPLAPRPGWVIGRAVFEDGRPIPKFRVTLSAGGGVSLGQADGVNGSYAIRTTVETTPVSAFVRGMNAMAQIPYGKEVFNLKLHPLDGKYDYRNGSGFSENSGPGIVRDYVLKMSGYRPLAGPENRARGDYEFAMYGGWMQIDTLSAERDGPGPVNSLQGMYPPESIVEVTLTPTGPAIDGSRPGPIVRTFKLGSPWQDQCLREIPFAPMTVTARLTEPGGAVHAVSLYMNGVQGPWQPSVNIDWTMERISEAIEFYLAHTNYRATFTLSLGP